MLRNRLLVVLWCLLLAGLVLSCATATSGTRERFSVSATGGQENGGSWWPSISNDGRFVAWHSWAENLVPGDTNFVFDVYIRDRVFGLNHLVSLSTTGQLGDEQSVYPMISGDGLHVAFCSAADNLVPGVGNGVQQIYARDWQTGVTELVSVSPEGDPADALCDRPAMSGDGRYVVYQSTATNLNAHASATLAIYLRDRLAGTTTCLSVSPAGDMANGVSFAANITPDGRYVAFGSWATNLGPTVTTNVSNIYLLDRQSPPPGTNGTFEIVSLANGLSGAQGNGDARGGRPALSANGRYVAFSSQASNLVDGDTNATDDVFLRDRNTGLTERVSVATGDSEGNGASGADSYFLAVSDNGRYVTFDSLATNFVANDLNATWDVFQRDRVDATTTCLTVGIDGLTGTLKSGYYGIATSSSGAYTVFDSHATNLVANDTNTCMDTFLWTLEETPSGPPVLAINQDDVYTNSRAVNLDVIANGVSQLRFKDDGGAWSEWAEADAVTPWTLPEGDGVKKVWLQGQYADTSLSDPSFDEIVLDTVLPGEPVLLIDGGASVTTDQNVALSVTATDAAQMRFRNGTDAWSEWLPFAANADWTLPLGDGLKSVSVQVRDVADNVSSIVSADITLDTGSANGLSVSINDGAAATNDPEVTLSLVGIGVTQFRVRNEENAWGDWQAFTDSLAWELSSEDGTKTVWVQGRDDLDNLTPANSAEILLDTTPPTDVSVLVNGGAAKTDSVSATLTIAATGATEMRFRNETSDWSSWEPYATSRPWSLSSGDGTKQVTLEVRDALGNVSSSSDSITLQTVGPTDLSVVIDGNATSTLSHHVTLTLSALGAAEMRFRNESGDWSAWETYATTKSWTLSSARGTKTVGFQCRDDLDNESTSTASSITLADFADVDGTNWAYAQIMACVDAGIVQGYWDGYHPTETVSRAQMAVYIARAVAGGDANVPTGPATATFTDVPTDYWAFKYIEYLADPTRSVVKGYWDGYHPEDVVTRDQMAVYVSRGIVTPLGDDGLVSYTPPTTATFADVATDFWAYKYIEYLAGRSIVQGYWDGYHPADTVTRDQMAVYIQRAFALPEL